jgi:hypothetical protein
MFDSIPWLSDIRLGDYLNSNFISAMGGATIGGLIGIVGQKIVIKHARQERVDAQNEKNRFIALVLLKKIIEINSNIFRIKEHLDAAKMNNKTGQERPFAYVMPILNTPRGVEISDDECYFAFQFLEKNLVNKIFVLDKINNLYTASLSSYAVKRDELRRGMPAHMDGIIGKSVLNEKQYMNLSPLMSELDSIVIDLLSRIKNDELESRKLLNDYIVEVNKKFKLNIKVEYQH